MDGGTVPIIKTHELTPQTKLDSSTKLQVYNALDCCITLEVLEEIKKTQIPPPMYSFERALQAPAIEMMLRGFKVDEYERKKGIEELKKTLLRLDFLLETLAFAVWEKPLNPNSQKQLQAFFYEHMKLPEVWTSKKGVKKLSMDRETLEKLLAYFHARPIVSTILSIRDHLKQLQIMETEVDPDGRMRTSINIAATETFRWSSSANIEGAGGNLQNIPTKLRKPFVSDLGWKLCGIDLEQTESRDCGWLFGILFNDWSYLDACEKGDLHTTTAKLIWPNLGWTNNPGDDRRIADGGFYRDFSYRDMSKRGGHLSNYKGTAWTAARSLKLPQKIMEEFQAKYLAAYPSFPRWWQWVAQELQTKRKLTNVFGVTRHFFGRPNDDTTIREAIAFGPQSTTAIKLNLGLWRIWKYMGTRVQLLAQIHDAVYFQYKESDNEQEITQQALKLIEVPFTHTLPDGTTRTMITGGECKVGWNWSNQSEKNPNGLAKYKGKDSRRRV